MVVKDMVVTSAAHVKLKMHAHSRPWQMPDSSLCRLYSFFRSAAHHVLPLMGLQQTAVHFRASSCFACISLAFLPKGPCSDQGTVAVWRCTSEKLTCLAL